jgi:hypothetical protein
MVTAAVLVALAVACRLLTPALHIWNFVPVGAVALYAGSRLPRRWAWAVPLAAMVLSDLVIDYGQDRPQLTRWTTYATLAATTWLGLVANGPKFRAWMLPVLSVGASSVFFVTTNLATWAEGQLYPMTWAGLIDCYYQAIPFHRNTLVSELLGTCLLFGLGPVFERATARLARAWGREAVERPQAAELREVA